MKLNLVQLMAIAFFYVAIIFTSNFALADTVKTNSPDSAQQAASEVVKEQGSKEQFGQTESGEQLLDDAKEHAGEKLDNLAEKAKSAEDLPDSERLFLKNLQGK